MLNNKVVLVTGGGGYLGREFVRALLVNGATAIVTDVDRVGGERAREQLKGEFQSNKVTFIHLDITDSTSVDLALEEVHAMHGKIDALVNNAYPRNANYGRKFEAVTYEDFCQNMSMHVGGYFLMSQKLAKYFSKQGFGNIVNISSIYGVMAPRFEVYAGTDMTMPVEYAAIKSAVIHLTHYMAQYFKGKNIRVNAISPGGILAGQPQKFLDAYNKFAAEKGMLDPQDIVGTLVYLLSDLSRYVNGQNIVVDDGWAL